MRGRVGIMVALVLVGVSGCTSDDDGPGPVRSSAAPVTASPTPSVARPVKPVQEPTRQSAEAFVKYFWETYNYGNRTNDVSPLQEVATPSCGFCKTIVQNIESVAAAGSELQGFELEVLGSATPDYVIKSGTIVTSQLRQQPGTSTSREGVVTKLNGYKSIDSRVALDWNASGWAVAGVDNDPNTRVDW